MNNLKHIFTAILLFIFGLHAPQNPAKTTPKFEIYHESFYTTSAYKGISEPALARRGNLAPLFQDKQGELKDIFNKSTPATEANWAQHFLKLKIVMGDRKILMDHYGVFQDGTQYRRLTREGFERLLILLFTAIPVPVLPTDWDKELDNRFPEINSQNP